ncbi:esterase FE4-like [Planococcus citri]|uniref:esterase FE4-like n=1 Tax=Planococcus citri TaxID=170843 RepID=UPI0031F7A088
MSDKVTITVNDGKIRGIKQTSTFSGTEFYSFHGVPYGQPPVGVLRFKDPVKVKPWKNIYDATVEKPGCVQFSLRKLRIMGTEDCLFANIHTTKLPPQGDEPLRSVIVNIHPGAFMFGSPNNDHFGSPNYIMQNNVVYVCLAFRLHILGFLNLGIEECSGNQGIKDIIMALQWVRDNIRYFGGDPENVTLLGSSSGSAIIHILMLSSAARGLFHKAVMMGMYLFDPSIPFEDSQGSLVKDYVTALGYKGNTDDKKRVLSFLRRQKPEVLLIQQREKQKKIQENLAPLIPLGIFLPTIDQGENAVLPESPRKLISSMMRIPLLIGFCDKESVMGFCLGELKKNTEKNFMTSFCQNSWGWGYELREKDISFIRKEIENFYNQGQPIERAILSVKTDIQTDIILSDVYDTLINVIANDFPESVYVFEFNFEGDVYTIKTAVKDVLGEKLEGTFHGCDFNYWSCCDEIPNNETREMISVFTLAISTFAKTGNPNCEHLHFQWKPSTISQPCYLNFNTTIKIIDGKLNDKRSQFWNELRKKMVNK